MSDALDLAEAHNRAFNDRAWHRAPEIYSPDLVTVEPGGHVIHGIDDFLAYGKGFAEAFPDSRNEVLAITVEGNRAVVEGTYKGTHTGPLASPQGVVPPTGRTLALRFCENLRGGSGSHRNAPHLLRSDGVRAATGFDPGHCVRGAEGSAAAIGADPPRLICRGSRAIRHAREAEAATAWRERRRMVELVRVRQPRPHLERLSHRLQAEVGQGS